MQTVELMWNTDVNSKANSMLLALVSNKAVIPATVKLDLIQTQTEFGPVPKWLVAVVQIQMHLIMKTGMMSLVSTMMVYQTGNTPILEQITLSYFKKICLPTSTAKR